MRCYICGKKRTLEVLYIDMRGKPVFACEKCKFHFFNLIMSNDKAKLKYSLRYIKKKLISITTKEVKDFFESIIIGIEPS